MISFKTFTLILWLRTVRCRQVESRTVLLKSQEICPLCQSQLGSWEQWKKNYLAQAQQVLLKLVLLIFLLQITFTLHSLDPIIQDLTRFGSKHRQQDWLPTYHCPSLLLSNLRLSQSKDFYINNKRKIIHSL